MTPEIKADESASFTGEVAEFGSHASTGTVSRVLHKAREGIAEGAHRVEEAVVHSRDRTADWISANPFLAVGIAAGGGALIGALVSSRFTR